MKCELRPTRMCFVSTVFFFLFFFCFLPLMTLEVGFGPLRIEAISEGGFPSCSVGKEPTCQFRRHRRCRFNPWVRKIPWRRKGQPAPVFLPGESYGQRSLMGYSPWSHRVGHDWAHTWMDLGIIILHEVSQTEKDKYHMTSFKCGILVFRKWHKWTYLQNSNRLINIKNKLMAPTGLEVRSSHVVGSLWLLEVKNCPQENWDFILVTARNWVLSTIMWV